MDWTPDEYLSMLRRQLCLERLLPNRNELAALAPGVLTVLILRAQLGLCPQCEMQPKIETDGRVWKYWQMIDIFLLTYPVAAWLLLAALACVSTAAFWYALRRWTRDRHV